MKKKNSKSLKLIERICLIHIYKYFFRKRKLKLFLHLNICQILKRSNTNRTVHH